MAGMCITSAVMTVEAAYRREQAKRQIKKSCPHCEDSKGRKVKSEGLLEKVENIIDAPSALSCYECLKTVPVR